jgi:hypothetical protein
MLFMISIITSVQAYVTPWIIPTYEKTGPVAAQEVVDVSTGFIYLAILAVVLGLVVVAVLSMNRKS